MKKNKKQIKLEYISWFSARGLKKLYASNEYEFEGKRKYSIDIWSTKDGRLLVRFHHRCAEAENCAYEIKGMGYADIPYEEKDTGTWIPGCVFEEFENWIITEMPFAVSMEDYFEQINIAACSSMAAMKKKSRGSRRFKKLMLYWIEPSK